MIDWLAHGRPEAPFLVTDERTWTYSDAAEEVAARGGGSGVIRPELSAGSVFEIFAALGSQAAMILPPAAREPVDSPPATTALVVFTSGSTGTPRGVRLTATNLIAASRASMIHLDHGPADRWLLAMPLHHVAGLSILVRSAQAGGSVRLLSRFDPLRYGAALGDDVTIASVVPTMLQRILEVDKGSFAGLRSVLVGGGPIAAGLLERAADAGIPVLPTYGMTETFGQVATLRPGSPLAYEADPLPGIEIRITDTGRIAVRGEQVSPGYLGEPDRVDEWFVTSDMGSIDANGALRVEGRADAVIVSGGENVDPVRVEEEIRLLDGLDDVIVVGVPDDVWGQLVTAVYSGPAEEHELIEAVSHLPGHLAPKSWLRVEVVPRTSLGKPDRQAALRLALGRE